MALEKCDQCGKKDYVLWITKQGIFCFECMYPEEKNEKKRNKKIDREIDKEWIRFKSKK